MASVATVLVPIIVGGVVVGQAIKKAKTEKEIGKQRKEWAEEDAAAILEESQEYAKQIEEEGREFTGRQRAIIGASAAKYEGSPLMIMEETSAKIEENIRKVETYGKKQAQRYIEMGELYEQQASLQATSTLVNMFTTFMGLYGGNIFKLSQPKSYTGASGPYAYQELNPYWYYPSFSS